MGCPIRRGDHPVYVVSAKPLVSIIIPSAADPVHLQACLQSLERNAPRAIPFEVIVVLNRPTDHEAILTNSSVEALAINSPVNLGLAGAGHRARDRASGDFLLILHDDAQVEPGWMEALVDAAREHPEAGAIGGMVLNPDRSLQSAGGILWRDGTVSSPWPGPPPMPATFETARAVDYIGTSSLLIRTATWDAVGGFDEQLYPVYYVDVDLAMRVRRHGQVVWYEPRSRILHHQGASGSLRWRSFLTTRNRERFVKTWKRELEDHEVFVAGSQDAIDRAIARASARAGNSHSARVPPAPKRVLEAAHQDLLAIQMDAAVHKDYAAHLTRELDELTKLHSSRWWSLYKFLQPLLRVLAKLAPRR